MGADGHIHIWKDEDVRTEFPDCNELFACLPTHYVNELDGTRYHHCYFGDNIWVYYADEEDWYLPHDWVKERTNDQEVERTAMKQRLEKFIKWLDANKTHWEVWT